MFISQSVEKQAPQYPVPDLCGQLPLRPTSMAVRLDFRADETAARFTLKQDNYI